MTIRNGHKKLRTFLLLFRPLLRGKELYTQTGFFCSVNFDRSIYCRELRLVSLESVEYGIKKIFLILVFLQGVIEV